MGLTKIEWADYTFNPWWGCTKVSPGCEFCYAEALDGRFAKGKPHWGPGAPRREMGEAHWRQPEVWNRKAGREGIRPRVFCGSMCDIMDDEAPASARVMLWTLIEATPNLIWMLLTKRPENYPTMLPEAWHNDSRPNVWLGATVEDEPRAQERMGKLLIMPAARHFVSYEPALGLVDWRPWLSGVCAACATPKSLCDSWRESEGGFLKCCPDCDHERHPVGLDWVIQGGETDPYGLRSKRTVARPIHPDWIRQTRDQCAAAGVPFFFKQWGEFGIDESADPGWVGDGYVEIQAVAGDKIAGMKRMGKKRAGNAIDGQQHLEVPTY